jgi:hypothetical protein
MERRIAEGLSKRDAIRCLKRHVARQALNDIRTITLTNTLQQAA